MANKYDHPKWKARRKEIFTIDNNRCLNCDSDENLHVHHYSYARGREIWDYPDEKLITLCASCHYEMEQERENLHDALIGLTHHQIRRIWKNIDDDRACGRLEPHLKRGSSEVDYHN